MGKRGEEEAKTALLPPSLFLRDEANLGLPLARDGQKGGRKKVFGVRPSCCGTAWLFVGGNEIGLRPNRTREKDLANFFGKQGKTPSTQGETKLQRRLSLKGSRKPD